MNARAVLPIGSGPLVFDPGEGPGMVLHGSDNPLMQDVSDEPAAHDENRGNTGRPPMELLQRFDVTRRKVSAEAEVFFVTERASNRRKVFKWYFSHVKLDPETIHTLARLSNTDRGGRHLARIENVGTIGGRWWELQPYYENGNLRAWLANNVYDHFSVVKGVAESVLYIHQSDLIHRGLKPENVLVGPDPFPMLLGDFGAARKLNTGQRYSERVATPLYMPPEACSRGKVLSSAAGDWWSLGMMALEIATGSHPFDAVPDTDNSDAVIESHLIQGSWEIPVIDDTRLTALCHGCLVQKAADRWSDAEVAEWLRGGSPRVGVRRAGPSARHAVHFAGERYEDPVQLAAAFQSNWSQALNQLFKSPDATLRGDTWALLDAFGLSKALTVLGTSDKKPEDPPRRFARLLMEMAPAHLEPVYNGVNITPAELATAVLKMATESLNGAGPSPTDQVIEEIREHRILSLWEPLPGCTGAGGVEARWLDCGTRLKLAIDSLKDHAVAPTPELTEYANALLLAVAAKPSTQLEKLRLDVIKLGEDAARTVPWWRELRSQALDRAAQKSVATDENALRQTAVDLVAARLALGAAEREQGEVDRTRRAAMDDTKQMRRERRIGTLHALRGLSILPILLLAEVSGLLCIYASGHWLIDQAFRASPWWLSFYVHWYSDYAHPMGSLSTDQMAVHGQVMTAAVVSAAVTVVLLTAVMLVPHRSRWIPIWLRWPIYLGALAGLFAAYLYFPWLISGFALGYGGAMLNLVGLIIVPMCFGAFASFLYATLRFVLPGLETWQAPDPLGAEQA